MQSEKTVSRSWISVKNILSYGSARLIRIVFQSRQNQFFTVCNGKSVFGHGNSVIAHDVNVVVIVALDGVRHYVVRASQFIYAVQLCISGRGYVYRFEAVKIKIIFAVLRPNYGRKFGIVLKRPRF